MYNAAIKYEIIVLAYILREIGDLEWNEYIDINEWSQFRRAYKSPVFGIYIGIS